MSREEHLVASSRGGKTAHAAGGAPLCARCRRSSRDRLCERCATFDRLAEANRRRLSVPVLRSEPVLVVTGAKLRVLSRIARGEVVGVRSSWIVRVLVREGLLREACKVASAGAEIFGIAELTPEGWLAVRANVVGAYSARRLIAVTDPLSELP